MISFGEMLENKREEFKQNQLNRPLYLSDFTAAERQEYYRQTGLDGVSVREIEYSINHGCVTGKLEDHVVGQEETQPILTAIKALIQYFGEANIDDIKEMSGQSKMRVITVLNDNEDLVVKYKNFPSHFKLIQNGVIDGAWKE